MQNSTWTELKGKLEQADGNCRAQNWQPRSNDAVFWPLAGWSTHLEVRLALVAVEGVAQPPHLPEHPPPGPHPRLRLQYELT